jgi:glycosyltransferase involved in cell wall biosynthesis
LGESQAKVEKLKSKRMRGIGPVVAKRKMSESKISLVTVILPHFGCEAYLLDAALSILAQELEDLELIVVDDASPTRQWLTAARQLSADPRVTLYQTNRNVGPYRIKNRLVPDIRSPYLAFQDADDMSHPQRLSRQIRFMEKTGADIVGCSFTSISEDGKEVVKRKMVKYGNFWMKLGKSFIALHPTTVVRRHVFDVLGGFDGTTHIAADSDFFLRAAYLYRIMNLKESLYTHRSRNVSLSEAKETGHGSKSRNAYVAAMWDRERQRRLLQKREDIIASLKAFPNDLHFELEPIRNI